MLLIPSADPTTSSLHGDDPTGETEAFFRPLLIIIFILLYCIAVMQMYYAKQMEELNIARIILLMLINSCKNRLYQNKKISRKRTL